MIRPPVGGSSFCGRRPVEGGQALYELCARLTMKHGLEISRQAISQHLEVLRWGPVDEREEEE